MKPRRLLSCVCNPLGVTLFITVALFLGLALKSRFSALAALATEAAPTTKSVAALSTTLAAAPPAAALQAVNTLLALRFEASSFNGEQGETPVQSASVTFQAGANGQGLFMDRGNRLTYESNLNINSTEGTIELWLKPNWNGNDGQNHTILRYGQTSGHMMLGKEGNDLRLALNRTNDNGSLELDVATNIQNWQTGQWHHVAAAWSNTGQFLRLYVDGALVSERLFTATLPTISSTTNPTFQIGGDSVRYPLLSTIDDVIISDGVRSAQEIATRMLTGLTISTVSLTPNVTTIDMYPDWTYWQDFKYAVTTPIGALSLPWQVGTLTLSAAGTAAIDSVTGRIKAGAPGTATITANFSGLQTTITVNVLTPQKAADTETIDSYLSTPRSGALYKIPVAIIRYFPAKNATDLDDSLTGVISTLEALRTKQLNVEKKLKFMLEEGSRFRGYQGGAPAASLGYQVVKIINVYEDLPPGSPTGTTGVYFPNYKQIFNRHNVQDLVMNQGVKEIWLEQYVNGRLSLDESNMASPLTGDVSKSLRTNDDMPVYGKSYTVFGLNFAESENNAARSRGHHLEALLTYANILQDRDDVLFQEEFIGRAPDGTFLQGRVGKADRPPNSTSDFEYNNPTEVDSDIEDWFPDGHGIHRLINRDAWANLVYAWPVAPLSQTEAQWYVYWMQALPGFNNAITRLETERMTNWWRFTADWDAAMQVKLGLTEPLSCQYTLSSTNSTVSLSGGNGSVNVTCGATCKWTASTNDSWIKLTTASGTGNGTVTFTVDALATGQRTGTIVIADQVFTLTQNDCVFALSTSTLDVAAAGGASTFTVTATGTSCPWTATKDATATWLTLSPASGTTGTTTVNVNVTANTGLARTATVTVADKSLTITQSSGCSYVFSPTSLSVSAQGGTSSIGVQAGTNCSWTATSNASWIQITAGTSGTGNGTVAITIATTDVATQRTGTLTIAGQTYNVTQAGANPLPTLTSVSPTSIGVGNAAFELTVNGTNFNSNSVVNWNGTSRVTTFVSATQLKAAITAADVASIGNASITVTNTTPLVGTTDALSFAVNNPTPVLNTLTPVSIVAGSAGFTLTLNGSGFVLGSVARVNGNSRTTSFVNSTQLTISLTAAEIATAGTLTVDVVNPTPVSGSSTSGQQVFTITNPLPSLGGLNPPSVTAGNGDFTLTVTGNGFVTTSVVNWNGSPRTTAFLNSTQLQAAITAADVAAAGTANLTVTNSLPGGGTTGALSFAINNPAPTLTSLSPATAIAGSAGVTLTLNGAGFVAASVAQVNSNNRTTSFVNSTQLTISLTAADLANAGTLTLVVVNPAPSGGTSGQQTFTVNNPAPTLTSLSQTSATAGSGAFTLTVNGTNFVSGSKVRWNGADRTTTFLSSTQLSASITAADVASVGTANVTVFNAAPGGGTSSSLSLTITAVSCSYSLTPTSQNFVTAGGAGSVAVNTGASCAWAVTNVPAWVTINGSNNGTGNGTVNFTVAANAGAARNGTLTIAGQTFTLTQDAALSTCTVQRTLPTFYFPGQAAQVSVSATPGASAQSYAVEETPPPGWTIAAIDNGGLFDAVNGKVKWGPFFDNAARTLSYTATPPANAAGTQNFSGSISINGVSSATCGTASIERGNVSHPADLNDNFRVDINELTAYGTAWKLGTVWSRAPNPIDINYLTNAGLLWKTGEVYHYDVTKAPPFAAGASLISWMDSLPPRTERVSVALDHSAARVAFSAASYLPTGGLLAAIAEVLDDAAAEEAAVIEDPIAEHTTEVVAVEEALAATEAWTPIALGSGTASASLNAVNYAPGVGITVTLVVTPDSTTQVYALEDTPPLNWSVAGINHNGAFDSNNKKVKWGPFFDNTPRTFTYVATPPAGESGSKSFVGFASFDGGSVAVTGNRTLSPQCTFTIGSSSQNFNASGGTGSFTVTASAGCSWSASPNTIWIIASQGSGSGNGSVNFSVTSNPGAARTGTITVGSQIFTINQAANITPTITPASALTRQQSVAANAVTMATVSDTETALGSLTVATTSVPAGLSVTSLTNTNGTISAVVTASCAATLGANTIGWQVTDAHGAMAQANLTVNVTSNPSCFLQINETTASDQRVGSVLLYSYYTSSISAPTQQNTQLRLTNTHESQETAVRLYFVDGQFGSVSSLFVCLPPNQTANFLLSEIDPGVTGYVIAVAVNKATGCPINFNYLLGGASVKLSSGHTANLSAIAIAALAATPTTCANSAATLNFDGTNYARLPRMLLTDSLPSLKDGNDTRLILARIGGSLIGGAGTLGTITGKIYNSNRTAQDFTFGSGAPQLSSSLSLTFPRLATRLDTFIPSGQSGWLRLWTDANIGILGTVINLPANLRTTNGFASGYNLPQGALTAAVSLEIPVSVPTCQ